jgi:hypothetical protein
MTKPKMVLCDMVGKPAHGPVARDGAAYCPDARCLSTIAPTKKVTRDDGKVEFVYADHYRRAHPYRAKRRVTPKYVRGDPRRDLGRRR